MMVTQSPTVPTSRLDVEPPHHISRPVMVQEWRDAAFLHWPVDAGDIQRLLPDDLTVDTFDGKGWVGLIAFDMVGIRAPGLPRVPYLSSFPETNVRTYVRDASGRPGVWFHSLDATRLLPVWTARVGYRLPYMWSRMSIDRTGDVLRYTARRSWPGPKGAGGTITIRPEAVPKQPSALDAFLTARWGLYTDDRSGRLRYAPVEHPAWPLHRADALHVRDSLVEAAGYPPPTGDPHVLWSPGVPVRVGLPTVVR